MAHGGSGDDHLGGIDTPDLGPGTAITCDARTVEGCTETLGAHRTQATAPFALDIAGDGPAAESVIAILIGALGTTDQRPAQNAEKVAAPAPLAAAPLGSTKGSLLLPYIEQDN